VCAYFTIHKLRYPEKAVFTQVPLNWTPIAQISPGIPNQAESPVRNLLSAAIATLTRFYPSPE
jgi:hypothetical protein